MKRRSDPAEDAERHIVYLRTCIDAGVEVVTYHLMVKAYIEVEGYSASIRESIAESLAEPDADAAWKTGL